MSLKTTRHACIVLVVLTVSSCTPKPTEPTAGLTCGPSESFYVVSHGRHTGLVVRRVDLLQIIPSLEEDFPRGAYLEVGWGDERFYRAETPTAGLALRAILWPTSTVLHVVSVPKNPELYFSQSEVLELSVPRAGYDFMLAFVVESFTRTSEKGIVRLGPGKYGDSQFYRAEGTFHAFNTCNTWVANAIQRTGYPLGGQAPITAEGLLGQLRQTIDEDLPCYSVR